MDIDESSQHRDQQFEMIVQELWPWAMRIERRKARSMRWRGRVVVVVFVLVAPVVGYAVWQLWTAMPPPWARG